MDRACRKSRLQRSIQEELIRQFEAGATARAAADLVGINRHTATLYFRKLRELIARQVDAETPFLPGEIELDESCFGGHRKGKRGRGAAGKVIIFGLLKRGGKVHTLIGLDTKTSTLEPIIRQSVKPDSIVHTDGYTSYDVLDVSEFKHHRINHSERFVEGKTNRGYHHYNSHEYSKIQSAIPEEGHVLVIMFTNGIKKKYNVSRLLTQEMFFPLKNPGFFKNVTVEPGGYTVSWNSQIDISEHELWQHGEEIP